MRSSIAQRFSMQVLAAVAGTYFCSAGWFAGGRDKARARRDESV